MAKKDLLYEALWFGDELGVAVVPVNGKQPTVAWGEFQDRRPTDSQLREWFADKQPSGMAGLCGPVSGDLVCRDFDSVDAYNRWAGDYPKWARTLPMVKTGRPGRHVWFRCDPKQIERESKSGSGIIDLGDGELRGCGAIALLPPSRHPNSGRYQWRKRPAEIPEINLRRTGLHKTYGIRESVDPQTVITETQCLVITNQIQQAIRRSLPTGPKQRHDRIFQLARELKGIPETANLPVDALRPVLEEWHRQAVSNIGTRSIEANWEDFREGFGQVRYPAGRGSIHKAFSRAAVSDMPPPEADRYRSPRLRLLAAACRELQRMTIGDEPFFLSSYGAASILDVTQPCAWNYLTRLCSDGILRKERVGDRKLASEYRYLGEL